MSSFWNRIVQCKLRVKMRSMSRVAAAWMPSEAHVDRVAPDRSTPGTYQALWRPVLVGLSGATEDDSPAY